ncbi:MAG: DUF5946 family protein [Pseudomonadota bacterium]
MTTETCPGCGVVLEAVDGPVHRYMESTPSCWAIYGEILAREYSNATYMSVHRLTVDAYAAQHPGQPCPQSIQSVAVHLTSLFSVLELGLKHAAATQLLKRCADTMTFVWLEPPEHLGATTVLDVVRATNAGQHSEIVKRWANDVWQAWSPHHAQIHNWASEATSL